MKRFCVLPLILLMLLSRHGTAQPTWQADSSDPMQLRVSETIEKFLEKTPQLRPFFEQAYGLAVFPSVIRAGLVWGGAYGRGLVIEQNRLIGSSSQWVMNLGPQIGVQSYSQVILFKDAAALDWFKQRHVEFVGRASVVAFKRGAAVDPAYNPSVAVFSLTKGGLMFEAAAGGVYLSYKPRQNDTE
ncbi:MAG: lipid-binding SYLF domain-containing protein [Pseudomonadota bacterium]